MSSGLSEDVKQVINDYLRAHRVRSLATLSRHSGVAYSTIRRLSQGEGNPTAEPVLKVLDVALGPQEKLQFLARHFPDIAESIAKCARVTFKDEAPPSEDLKAFFGKSPHNLILNLAISVKHTSVETIQRLCGVLGLNALDEMVACDVLAWDHATGCVSYRDDSFLSVDCDFLLNQIAHSAAYFDRTMIGTDAARLGHATGAINLAGLRRIHEIMSHALQEITAVKEDAKYFGDVTFFAGGIMNVYDKASFDAALAEQG